jgi:hypothetical protein
VEEIQFIDISEVLASSGLSFHSQKRFQPDDSHRQARRKFLEEGCAILLIEIERLVDEKVNWRFLMGMALKI